ncbi:MAG: uroporphyrinogen decarboxylase family protein [Candidatus Omnitrophica bacterium]|nr:uroporphyrinogen decarboxylase family protein [Candidatus Omnitrophota bacterium]
MLEENLNNRIKLALNFQEPDRVPICEFIDSPKVFRYFSHSKDIAIGEKVKAYHELGIDVCWQFERRRNYRHEGFLKRLQKFALRKLKIEVLSDNELNEEMEDFRQQQGLFAPHTYLAMSAEGILSVAYKMFGYEEFCKKMYVELIQIERLIDIYAENLYQRALRFADADLGPLFFINDDIAYDKGLMFSKVFLVQHWLPRIQRSIEPLKDKGIKVILHSRGNITGILDELINLGIDGIHPIDPLCGMNIGILKKTYAKNLLLFGNIDISGYNSVQVIEEKTKKCINNASFNGGHFIGSVKGIGKSLSLQEVFTYFTSLNEYGKYNHPENQA